MRTTVAGLALAALLALPGAAGAQTILQAQVLELTALEVQVILTGARPTDEVRCLVRGPGRPPRVRARRPVADGAASGPAAVLSLALPLLEPGEREFAVALVRRDAVLARTPWRPLFAAP